MFKYKNEEGIWLEYKLPAKSVLNENSNTTLQETINKQTEEINTLKASGGKAGYVTSPSGINYKLCVTDDGQLFTQSLALPKVNIIGSLDGIGADRKVWAELEYEGEVQFRYKIKIEWQGNSSLAYPKKNFGITLYDNDENKTTLSIRGWDATSDFHLKANYIDATHARNVLNARWAKLIQGKPFPNNARGVIDGFPVKLYRNGEFYGIYTWNLKQDTTLFQMSKSNPDHLMYRAEYHDGAGSFQNWSNSDIQRVWENRIPKGVTTHTKLARMIEWVATADDNEFRNNIHKYLDLQACLVYYTMMEIMYLPDNRCKNMTLATWDGLVWYPIFYDLDTSWGLHWNGGSTYSATSEIDEGSALWDKLKVNFAEEIRAKYIELRSSVFTKSNIINEFQAFANIIGEENYALDQGKWTGIPSKNYGIPFMKNWIDERFAYLDQKYNVVLED